MTRIQWRAYYWHNKITTLTSDTHHWQDAPTEGVLWVDVMWNGFTQRLQGRDNYWLAGDSFGTYNDPHNLHWYGGNPTEQANAYRAVASGSVPIDPAPPDGAHVLAGVMLPDDEWEVARHSH